MNAPLQINVRQGLSAHFKQPTGPSRAGTDWAVSITDAAGEHRLIVRVYADVVKANAPTPEGQLIANYLGALVESGWSPVQYQGTPGELTVPGERATTNGSGDTANKPWWRFW